MQVVTPLVWIGLLLVKKIVDAIAKRPLFNTWSWLAGSRLDGARMIGSTTR